MIYWREQAKSYPCPVCNAGPGQPCLTNTGRQKYEVHADRGRQGDRCPRCGTRLLAEQEAGDLCSRCALVRALEVERATHYRRKHP